MKFFRFLASFGITGMGGMAEILALAHVADYL
jgi:hypothetical protein